MFLGLPYSFLHKMANTYAYSNINFWLVDIAQPSFWPYDIWMAVDGQH